MPRFQSVHEATIIRVFALMNPYVAVCFVSCTESSEASGTAAPGYILQKNWKTIAARGMKAGMTEFETANNECGMCIVGQSNES